MGGEEDTVEWAALESEVAWISLEDPWTKDQILI